MRVVFIQRRTACSAFDLALDEVDGGGRGLVVDRLHPLLGERAGILDLAVGARP